jgi:hypothetical protein
MYHITDESPNATWEPVSRLDDMINEFVMSLTNSWKYLDILSEGNCILARRRLFLPIREGGNGMTSAFGT